MKNKSISEIIDERMEYIAKHREILLEAFIAETGFKPSEVVMCQQEAFTEDGVVFKIWFEKKGTLITYEVSDEK